MIIDAERIARALDGHRSRSGWIAHCPAHEDRNASLSVSDAGGQVLVYCHAGCSQQTVIEALRSRGLWNGGGTITACISPLSRENKKGKPKAIIPIPISRAKESFKIAVDSDYTRQHYGALDKTYSYRLPDGEHVFVVCRHQKNGKKDIRPWYFGADDHWHVGQAMEDGRPLYHLPELLANPAAPVLVVEGEKCADVAVKGYMLTTWAGGAESVKYTDWSPLKDRNVTIWPDYDSPGLRAAREILDNLPRASILAVKQKPIGWDIADA